MRRAAVALLMAGLTAVQLHGSVPPSEGGDDPAPVAASAAPSPSDGSTGPRQGEIGSPTARPTAVALSSADGRDRGGVEPVRTGTAGDEEGSHHVARSLGDWEGLPSSLDCLEPAPAAAGVAGVTDDGRTVTLDVLVLADRMHGLTRARYLMREAERAFAPLGLDLNPRFEEVELHGSDAPDLLEQARVAARSFPLEGIDLVHVVTGVDLVSGGNQGVAGQAYCIGGIRFKSGMRAVSISEGWYTFERSTLGVPVAHVVVRRDVSALIVAHEIGHLLGAHHYHGNCGENVSATAAMERREVTPCTVMDQTLFYSSARFGQIEGAVVRGHAATHATP